MITTFARKTGFSNGHKWEIGIGNAKRYMTRGIRLSKGGYKFSSPILRYPRIFYLQLFPYTLCILWQR